MYTQEQLDRYNHQQTEVGKVGLQVAEDLKKAYSKKLGIPVNKMKTGKLNKMVNEHTGDIQFYET